MGFTVAVRTLVTVDERIVVEVVAPGEERAAPEGLATAFVTPATTEVGTGVAAGEVMRPNDNALETGHTVV